MDSPADGTAWEGSGGWMNTAHLQESESHYCVMQYGLLSKQNERLLYSYFAVQ